MSVILSENVERKAASRYCLCVFFYQKNKNNLVALFVSDMLFFSFSRLMLLIPALTLMSVRTLQFLQQCIGLGRLRTEMFPGNSAESGSLVAIATTILLMWCHVLGW